MNMTSQCTLDHLTVSEYRILHTPAGYYVGRQYFDPEMPECGMSLPYDRISTYFEDAADAQPVLEALVMTATPNEDWAAVGEYFWAEEDGVEEPILAMLQFIEHGMSFQPTA